jgi:hypothetical protein
MRARRGADIRPGFLCKLEAATEAALIVPDAFSTPAFEHVNDAAGVGVYHRSDQLQSFTAGTAGLAGVVLDNGNFLSTKKFHGPLRPKPVP